MRPTAAGLKKATASAAPAATLFLLAGLCAVPAWTATAPASSAPVPGIAIQSHAEADACAAGGPGNGDGVLDPGEAVSISVTALNNYAAAAAGVVGTLTCSTQGVAVTAPASSFGDMAAGATATSATPFSITLSQGLACGTSLDFTLTFESSQGVSAAGFSLAVGRVTPATTVTLLSEGFESWPPPGWTRIADPTTGGVWDSLAHSGGCIAGSSYPYANNTGGSGLCADANSDCFGDAMDTTMVTPSFSLASPGLLSAQLQFKSDFYCAASLDEGWVDVTTDEGAVWTNLLYFDHQSVRGPNTQTLDLTPYLGQPDVRLSFEYASPGWDWYWQVDDVTVTAVQQGSCSMNVCAASPCALSCTAAAPASALPGAAVSFAAEATPSGGCTGTPSYSWDFGDGQTSSEQNPSHAYAAPGSYGWTVTAALGGATCSESGTITVSSACALDCSASAPASATAGAPVSFTSTAAPSGGCTGTPSYSWDFGDGQTSTEQNPSHTYASAGSYAWTLTANDGGVTCSKGGTVVVSSACSYTLAITSKNFGHKGGSAKVRLTISGPGSCGTPPVSSSETWVKAAWKGESPRKNLVAIEVDPNSSATPRSAQVFVGDAVFSATQDGAPCKVTSVSPVKQTVDAAGGDEQIAVTATEGECPWTAAPNGAASSWITMLEGSGSGPGAAVYAVAPNTTGKKRTGTVSVATAVGKKTVTVKQTP